jgi:hypothetical protein
MAKKFGIRITLPETDPMRAPHLLGENWEFHRWYETAAERDRAFEDMQIRLAYYRSGDRPSQCLSKVDRDH